MISLEKQRKLHVYLGVSKRDFSNSIFRAMCMGELSRRFAGLHQPFPVFHESPFSAEKRFISIALVFPSLLLAVEAYKEAAYK